MGRTSSKEAATTRQLGVRSLLYWRKQGDVRCAKILSFISHIPMSGQPTGEVEKKLPTETVEPTLLQDALEDTKIRQCVT